MNAYTQEKKAFNSEIGDFCLISFLRFIVFTYVCETTSPIKQF